MSAIQDYCKKWIDAEVPHNEKQILKKDPVYRLYRFIADDEARLAAAHQETHRCIAFDRAGESHVIDQPRLDAACNEIERLTGILSINRRCMERLDDLMKDQPVPFLRVVERQKLEDVARKAKEILAEAQGL